MKISEILFLLVFSYFNSNAFSHSSHQRWRTKREYLNLTEHESSENGNNTNLKITAMTTTTDASYTDDCNTSAVFDSGGERIRRSVNQVFQNITTTETPPNTAINVSMLHPEYLKCDHIFIVPECYEMFHNGSVFVPLYNMMFNISNYIIYEEHLVICPNFFDKFTEDVLITTTTTIATNITVGNPCNSSTSDVTDVGRIRRSSRYSLANMTTTETPPDTTIDISTLSKEFLECTHIYVEPECYEKYHNGTVFVPMFNMLFHRSNYIINQQLLFVCSNIFDKVLEDKFSEDFPLVSFICACISAVCIILHIIMFVIVKTLRNLPGYCLLSLCLALIGAYLCIFVQLKEVNLKECTILGMFMLYFFLASFFWMNVMAYDVWKSIRMATAKFRLTTNRPFLIQFIRYSIYAWGTPLNIIIISIIIHNSSSEDSKYRLIFDENTCWFKYKSALTLYFAGPLIMLIVLNVLLFVSSFYMISNASMSKSKSKNNQGSSDLWSRLFLSLRLGSVMGFMWIFGIIATMTKQQWLWYLYSACSALQGVFIFFSFTVSERTRKACKKVLQKRECSVSPTQTSSQQATSF